MCQCGCRGWCTWFPIVLAIAWDLAACARGGHADGRNQFGQKDASLEAYAVLCFVIAVIELRADWPAWAEVAGIRIWKHAIFPCPKCDMRLVAITCNELIGQIKLNSQPWNGYTHEHYLQDIKKHSVEACNSLAAIQFIFMLFAF